MRILASVYFDLPGDGKYGRLARALQRSAEEHCAGWDIRVSAIQPQTALTTRNRAGRNGLATNTDKLREWVAIVESCSDGDEALLVDCDTFIRASIDSLWSHDFDCAYTLKDGEKRNPINGGVFAVRVNDRSRAFMSAWLAVNDRLYADPAAHAPWRAKYGGMNQAALGYMLESGDHSECDLVALPCAVWNCCYEPLWKASEQAKIVHVKSNLRKAVLLGRWRSIYSQWSPLIQEWLHYDSTT